MKTAKTIAGQIRTYYNDYKLYLTPRLRSNETDIGRTRYIGKTAPHINWQSNDYQTFKIYMEDFLESKGYKLSDKKLSNRKFNSLMKEFKKRELTYDSEVFRDRVLKGIKENIGTKEALKQLHKKSFNDVVFKNEHQYTDTQITGIYDKDGRRIGKIKRFYRQQDYSFVIQLI